MNDCSCKKKCHCDKGCKNPCGCAEPTLSIEAMPDDPTILRFNINGKSVWYDFSSVVKHAETCTTLTADAVDRTLNYEGECGENTITGKELGAILHLADIGDVNENTIKDNGILNYRVSSDCPEGCDGASNEWVSTNPVEVGTSSLSYILGSDADGKMFSLMPPEDSNTFSYLAWRGSNKAGWAKPTQVATIPNDGTYEYPLYLDPATGEIVVYKRSIQ